MTHASAGAGPTRRPSAAIGVLLAAALLLIAPAARAGDPYLEWWTVKTPHFRIYYHSGLRSHAQRLARLAEETHRRLVPPLGWSPSEVTHVVLTDDTDAANGSATALPFNAIRMFISAPDDMSVLADYDDWLLELFTHEYVHILHVDNISGIPAILNAVLGKSFAPNQAQPRWVLEGLAVAMESAHTSGGRVRATTFDMFLRTDVLEGNLARLDQMSHSVRRWPSGNLWYLYGGKFVSWINEIYGPDTFAAVATDYGQNPIPWGINRSIRRATGRTYVELYASWHEHLKKKYGAMVARVKKRGLREGTRLTHRGRVAASPRFVPQCARAGAREEILVYHDDGHDTGGYYRLPLESRSRAAEDDAELLARASGGRVPSFDGECGFVFDSSAVTRRRYRFRDLIRQPPGTKSPRGIENSRERWTVGRRAREPAVSPDGRRIVYVTNRAGTTTLRIADVKPKGGVHNERILVPSATYEQAFTPRWSPDGKHVTYGAWTTGGYRNVRVVEVATGRFYNVTNDRALDQQPTFSPDGKRIFFKSDRTGIPNIYAYEIATGKLWQVTNVINGAFMPEITPDGRTLFYIGYTHAGYDLFSMALDESQWLPALDEEIPRPEPHDEPSKVVYPVERYNPLPTLRPRAYELEYGPGTFGNALIIRTDGTDAVGHHGFAARLTIETELSDPMWAVNYVYRRLPFDFRARAFQSAVPRTNVQVGSATPVVTERMTGATTGVSFGIPDEFDSHSVSLSYTVATVDTRTPISENVDPYALRPRFPDERFFGLVSLGWSYSNSAGSTWGISRERGFNAVVTGDYAAHAFGSETTLTAINARITGYLQNPWIRHHVLALAASAGSSTGSYPRRGFFFTGGFADADIVEAFGDGISQAGFVLRGYEPRKFVGSQYNLLNVEYRFPVLYPERGVSTLPAFWRTLSANVFADYGGAFNRIDLDDPFNQYHLGVGAELWFDLVIGYFAGGNIRFGHARGLDEQAVQGGQTYMVLSSGF